MIINGASLLQAAPIVDMLDHKVQAEPTSYGLTECGYDIRIKQGILFIADGPLSGVWVDDKLTNGRFVLGSSIEEFQMPDHLMGQVMNKSTWARLGLDASMTTNIEPGWKGFLTIELTYHGQGMLNIPSGSGIAQVLFHEIKHPASYVGKYQNQDDRPVPAITEK